MTVLTLQKMSAFVYDLPIEYRNIIKYLAEHGSGNLTNIAEFTKKSETYPLDRWSVKKRIYGTNRILGLIDGDYIIEKLENKHRFKKQERTFYLRSKGIIASFATTSISNNAAFKKIIEFADLLTKGKKESQLIQEFIISQIKYFLAYQYLQGSQLTWNKHSWEIYSNFLDNSEFGIDMEIKNSKLLSEFRQIFENYIILKAIYEYVGGKIDSPMGNNTSLWDYLDYPRPQPLRNDLKLWHDFVFKWFLSPQSQIPESKEFTRMVCSRYQKFVADEHLISKSTVLKTRLKQKLKNLGIKNINF